MATIEFPNRTTHSLVTDTQKGCCQWLFDGLKEGLNKIKEWACVFFHCFFCCRSSGSSKPMPPTTVAQKTALPAPTQPVIRTKTTRSTSPSTGSTPPSAPSTGGEDLPDAVFEDANSSLAERIKYRKGAFAYVQKEHAAELQKEQDIALAVQRAKERDPIKAEVEYRLNNKYSITKPDARKFALKVAKGHTDNVLLQNLFADLESGIRGYSQEYNETCEKIEQAVSLARKEWLSKKLSKYFSRVMQYLQESYTILSPASHAEIFKLWWSCIKRCDNLVINKDCLESFAQSLSAHFYGDINYIEWVGGYEALSLYTQWVAQIYDHFQGPAIERDAFVKKSLGSFLQRENLQRGEKFQDYIKKHREHPDTWSPAIQQTVEIGLNLPRFSDPKSPGALLVLDNLLMTKLIR